jgi:hypothetical protein
MSPSTLRCYQDGKTRYLQAVQGKGTTEARTAGTLRGDPATNLTVGDGGHGGTFLTIKDGLTLANQAVVTAASPLYPYVAAVNFVGSQHLSGNGQVVLISSSASGPQADLSVQGESSAQGDYVPATLTIDAAADGGRGRVQAEGAG